MSEYFFIHIDNSYWYGTGLGHTPIFKEIIELGIDSPGPLPLFLLGKNFVSSICRVRVSESFVNQATPRFELGRKDS